MIKLPSFPFKVSSIDENDPFVANALRERKHYEPCWCGSGIKYKKCHRLREEQKPFSLGKIQNLQKKVFWRKRGCMHPLAGQGDCRGKIIDSHTIQRKGPLERIVDETSHVMHFKPDSESGGLIADKTGWKKASIFPGYCSYHDSRLFEPIEKEKFTGEHWQNILHAFRNVCNELYRKKALIESFEFQKTCVDRGFDIDRQINFQISCNKSIENNKKSVEEMERLRDKFEDAIIQNKPEVFESKCYFFEGDLEVVSSSVFQCEFDFRGNKLVNLWDLTQDAQLLSHTIVNTDTGGAIVFVWAKDEKDPKSVVESFDNISDEDKGDIFVQYCFVNCENTFFSEVWWNKLKTNQKDLVTKYANALYYEGGEFTANEDKLVSWKFI